MATPQVENGQFMDKIPKSVDKWPQKGHNTCMIDSAAAKPSRHARWNHKRHRIYMDANLKALCDLACAENQTNFSAFLQRCTRSYVRRNLTRLRARLALLPESEQARLDRMLRAAFKKLKRAYDQ
jgi:hypothetical protein